ncbi:MAG: response regulator [bacterium]|nr:response regulator [bacterium]
MAPSKYTIAIIEDEKMLLKYMASSLSSASDFRVVTAMDGEEGEQLVIKEKPDLVFLDLIMPKKNGFEVLESLTKSPETKKIPIVILSNLGQEKDIAQAKQLGARDYLIKVNLEINDLVRTARSYLDTP